MGMDDMMAADTDTEQALAEFDFLVCENTDGGGRAGGESRGASQGERGATDEGDGWLYLFFNYKQSIKFSYAAYVRESCVITKIVHERTVGEDVSMYGPLLKMEIVQDTVGFDKSR